MKLIDVGNGLKIRDYWSGRKLGVLTVLHPIITPQEIYNFKTLNYSNLRYQCQCECGELRVYSLERLRTHRNLKYGLGCHPCRLLSKKEKEMNKHLCNWCKGETAHKMFPVHGRDSLECCYCNPKIAIDSLPEPYITIAKRIQEQQNPDHDDCCNYSLDSVLDDVISMGIREMQK